MFLARVEGSVVATKKDANMTGRKLLLIRPHLLTPPPSAMRTYSFQVGSETRPSTPL